jgi:hypothetical protein
MLDTEILDAAIPYGRTEYCNALRPVIEQRTWVGRR